MEWQELISESQTDEERADAIRIAMMDGVPKHEIEAFLDELDRRQKDGETRIPPTGA